MTIGYDNEAGRCVCNSALESGHWYVDEEGNLFIVPDAGEIEGPDGATLDALNSAYRVRYFDDVHQEDLARQLNLTVAYSWQQRFDPRMGYFVA
jgi:hypothetical protein